MHLPFKSQCLAATAPSVQRALFQFPSCEHYLLAKNVLHFSWSARDGNTYRGCLHPV